MFLNSRTFSQYRATQKFLDIFFRNSSLKRGIKSTGISFRSAASVIRASRLKFLKFNPNLITYRYQSHQSPQGLNHLNLAQLDLDQR